MARLLFILCNLAMVLSASQMESSCGATLHGEHRGSLARAPMLGRSDLQSEAADSGRNSIGEAVGLRLQLERSSAE